MKDAAGKKVEQKPNGGVNGALIIGRNAPLSVLNQKGTPGTSTPSKRALDPCLDTRGNVINLVKEEKRKEIKYP